MMTTGQVLIVAGDSTGRSSLARAIAELGFDVLVRATTIEATRLLESSDVDVDVCLAELPRSAGAAAELCRSASGNYDIPVILVSGPDDLDVAVAALREGASDLLVEPFSREDLAAALGRAVERRRGAPGRIRRLGAAAPHADFSTIVGSSTRVKALAEQLASVASSNANVLVTGESGTGKELIARAIHDNSARRDGPFVAVNCAAVPAAILEAELFGHLRGAFTGATEGRRGLFLQAHGGTLMLDEVGAMPIELQASLLRALQERAIRRIGATVEERVDARVIAATNSDLEERVRAGAFRADLLFRLDVLRVEAPPLRERGDDVVELSEHFLARAAARRGAPVLALSPDAVSVLRAHDWPGNVRELENCIEAAVALAQGPRIELDDLPLLGRGRTSLPKKARESLESLQAEHIEVVLDAVGGNMAHAARVLGVDRGTLYRWLRRKGVNPPRKERA